MIHLQGSGAKVILIVTQDTREIDPNICKLYSKFVTMSQDEQSDLQESVNGLEKAPGTSVETFASVDLVPLSGSSCYHYISFLRFHILPAQ